MFRPHLEALEDRRLLAAVITVNSTADNNARDAELTLREAMLINNRTLSVASLSALELLQVIGLPTASDADTIRFSIPPSAAGHVYYKNDGAAGQLSAANVAATSAANDGTIADIDPDWPHSWFSIAPTSPLPLLTAQATIDGLTQSGAVANTNPAGQSLNSVLKIEINGSNAGQVEFGLVGIASSAGGSMVRGLVLNRATGPKVMFEAGAADNRVESNYLGPDVSGTVVFAPPAVTPPLPGFLRSNGVFAWTGGNTIGGTTADKRNLISGNNFATTLLDSGIALRGFGSPTLVQGNLIGTDRTGTKVLGNVGYGVLIDSPNNVIGGAGAGNVIAGNQSGGIYAASSNNTGGVIHGNWIGTDVSATLDLGNAGAGVLFGSAAGGNRVEGNSIAFNQVGIQASTQNQLITQNSIFSNDEQGIDGSSPTPVLTAVTAIAAGTRVVGTLSGTAGALFRIELFANPERDEFVPATLGNTVTPGTFGEGKTYIGKVESTIPTGGTANFSVDLPVNLLTLSGQGGQPFVTATATDLNDTGSGPRNRTSQFSAVAALGGPSFVVSATADTGLGTLREAIFNANTTAGGQTITFAIPAADPRHFYYQDDGVAGNVSLAKIATTTAATDDSIPTSGAEAIDPDWPHSWYSIRPSRDLPAIIDTITIDGYSQAGSSENTLAFPQGLNTVLKIELDGTNAAGDGLKLGIGSVGSNIVDASSSTIKGLAINRFGGDGIELNTLDGGIAISGNFIGTDLSGTVNLGNHLNGIRLLREQNTVIGTVQPATRSLISGNDKSGIEYSVVGTMSVVGFIIGWDRTMTRSLVNGLHGITTELSSATTLAAAASSQSCNVDPDRLSVAISFSKGAIQAGDVGAAVRQALIDSGDPCKAEITETVLSETAEFESSRGLFAAALESSPPLIDLGGDGVTPNDGDNPVTPQIDPDSDEGPNGLQNFPMLSVATRGTGTTITGALNSHINTSFRIEFFSNSRLHATGHGPGESYLGFTNVTTNSFGNASFIYIASAATPVGHFITATATLLFDVDDDPQTPLKGVQTSEFSAGIAVRQNPWHNQAKPLDVKPDGFTVARDALEIINYINAFGSGAVPGGAEVGIPFYYDASNDGVVAPNDALDVINFLNAFGAESEGEASAEGEAAAPRGLGDDWLALLAMDLSVQLRKK